MDENAALILVDLQKDFCPGGALAVPQGDATVKVANRILRECPFRLVVASQDWHPPDHASFASSHPGHSAGSTIRAGAFEEVLWPVHCVQHSRGAELVDSLHSDAIQKTFYKGTDPAIDSYSCFFDNHHRRSTGMSEFLFSQDIESVYLLGLATDYCVKYSALDGVRLGFRTHIILDGCRGIDLRTGDVQSAVTRMQESGVRVIQSKQLCPARP